MFFITITFPFMVELIAIVTEKEIGLRGQMIIGGLRVRAEYFLKD
jgi:hypothetical protein